MRLKIQLILSATRTNRNGKSATLTKCKLKNFSKKSLKKKHFYSMSLLNNNNHSRKFRE